MSWKVILCVVCLSMMSASASAQILIDDSQTVEWNVLNKLAGPGVTISNIQFNSQPITDVNPQIVSFDGTGCNVGLDGGIILSNGNASSIIGPNDESQYFLGTTAAAPTDADLLQLSAPEFAFDAAILEFTFIPNGDTVEFDFVFASEEYPFVPANSAYNDVFGFFVAGPGISGPFSSPNLPPFNFPDGAMNVALIPGTTTPVSIATVNESNNSAYFIPNGDGNTSPQNTDPQYIQADGFTTPITVKFPVVCGEQYYIKFALGDVFDSAVDSYVFIEEDSFSTIIPTEVSVADGSASMFEGCNSTTLEFSRSEDADLSFPATVDLTVTGSATNGVDYTAIPSSIQFPVGEETISLTIDALADGSSEGTETLNIHVENYGSTFCGQPIASDVSITIDDNASATMSGGGLICPGSSTPVQIDLVGGGPWEVEYTFNSVPVTETVNSSPHIINATTTGDYVLTSVTAAGCPGTVSGSASVTMADIPSVNIIGGGDFCEGSNVTATLVTSGTAPFEITYTVNGSPQTINVLDNDPVSISISSSATVLPVSITSPSISSCPGNISGSAEFTMHNAPQLTTISNVGICSGADAQIPMNISGTGPWTVDYSFNSTPQPSFVVNSSGEFFETSIPGNYEITQITSQVAPFCSTTLSEVITVQNYTVPTATIATLDSTICIGGTYGMDVSFTGDAPWTFTYAIDGVDQGSIQCFQDTTIGITDPGMVTISSISDMHCSGTTSGQTDINIATPIGNPAPTFLNQCVGSSVDLTTSAVGGINQDYNYGWEQGSNFLGSNDMITVNPTLTDPNTSEQFNYLLTVSQDACNLDYIFTYTVQINPIPHAEFLTSDGIVCPGDDYPIEILNSGAGEKEIVYSINGITQGSLVTEESNYTFMATEAGIYNLEVVQDDFCTSPSLNSSLVLSHHTLPEAMMETGDTTLCVGTNITTEINFIGTAPFTFDHMLDGSVESVITTSDNPYVLDISAPGTHSIGGIADANCHSSGTGLCNVDYFTGITVQLTDEFVSCSGDELEVVPLNLNGGDDSSYEFSWSVNSIEVSNDPTLVFNPTESGMITLEVNDFCNIESGAESNMIIESFPEVVITTENQQVCPGTLVQIDNLSIVDTQNNAFLWDFGDGSTASTMEAVHIFQNPGDYDVSLTITTPNGCVGEHISENMIHVNTVPTVDFSFDPEVGNMSDPEIQFENLSTDISYLKWSFGDGHEDDEIHPVHTYPEDRAATYLVCLEVTNIHGCSSDLCKTIEIEPIYNAFIPTAFTPDADGVNELFGPVLHTSDIAQYDFVIYDRDGHEVFHSIDPEEKWNGSYLTSRDYYVANGVYTWTLRIKLENYADVKVHKGTVTVVR